MSTQKESTSPGALFSHLRTIKSSNRIKQIEKVRSNGVGELVALPQLAVCGDQSAGKSSVLEGITGIPFPRQEGLCTRFPTEIILCHSETSQQTTITASIRPHSSRTKEIQNTLASYRKVLQDINELPSVIQEVSKRMEIRGYTEDGNGLAFAPDALRIEITGPIGLHLSVVDLPGLIEVPDDNRDDEDVNAVMDMVTAYLESSRTIILAVVQASNDVATQKIIRLARHHDPEGQRTVGIITKPDLINVGSESRIARIAKNQDTIKLKLGFFLVKNPAPTEIKEQITMTFRSQRELEFFSEPKWASQHLDRNRVGANKLRQFLQVLLDSHIEKELPKVRDEIKKSLTTTEAELRFMGDARSSVAHVRSFMTNLSMKYYELLQAALNGSYQSIDVDFFSQIEGSRLRARIQQINTDFAKHMRDCGERRKIGTASKLEQSSVSSTAQLMVTEAQMTAWVREVYMRTRGKELPGNHNLALLAELFHEQSLRWASIAEAHIVAIREVISQWTEKVVKNVVREDEDGLRREVGSILQDSLDSCEKLALEELNKLLEDERQSPLTYNHYYTDNIQKSRVTTQKAAVRNAIFLARTEDWNGKLHINNDTATIERFISAVESRIIVDMDEQACKEALTQLNAYYKVAMKTFTDNVTRQVIERHMISPLPQAFCPTSIAQLSDEELLRIGSEPNHEAERRTKLANMAQALRQSLVDLQRPVY
ncbi:hypothetical protein EYB25_007410 [Talaromyces marneffei]|uniref:Interferon-induced GTP-binding protein Mx n=1 Tax=Talaromyces marneffei PM1 TaxID=1077442 RepID=A0A093V7N0_TALMA|nr:hypothetical protein EYB25_007410 [Talaromyces marneffei]